MIIREIEDKKIWEDFFIDCREKSFLQSFNWGEFQKKLGNKIWRLGIYDDNLELIGVAQTIKIKARRGKFLLVPHGPIVKIKNEKLKIKNEILKYLLEELKKIGKKEKISFIRISPIWERNEENEKIFKDLGFRDAPILVHPEITWELDLEKPEEILLKEMRKTTRYLINQGIRETGLSIKKSKDIKDVAIFNNLYEKTVDRHHFVPFSLDYLKNEFLAFSRDPSASPQGDGKAIVFLAEYREECLAGAVIIFWQGMAFYHQGASWQKEPKIPASYVLQWEAIKEAKRRGCKVYNFWGIADINSKFSKHPWWGLSLFKMGFGGRVKEYIKTKDYPLSFKYWLIFAFEKLRSKKRGF